MVRLKKREALVKRKTRETDVEIYLSLDGEKNIQMDMAVPFFLIFWKVWLFTLVGI